MPLLSFSYTDLQKINWKDFFMRLYTKAFDEEDLLSNAAQVAFYLLLALFPLLLLLVSIFGLVLVSAGDLRSELFFYLQQAMPGSAYELVQKTIEEVTENSSGGKLTFGILATLWAASAGIDSIRVALNGVYNLTETRAWWKTKLISLLMTLGLGILVTLALGVVFYGSKFTTLILNSVNLPIQSPVILGILQFTTAAVVIISIFAVLYNFLPNHKKNNWVWITPGAIVGIILWLGLSYAFKFYLSYFNTYDKTYGSLGAVIILMLWLYLTALVILIGGSMNAVLQEFTDPETAAAGEKKAAAKEIVKNPDASPKIGSTKETGIPEHLVKKGDNNSEAENNTPKNSDADDADIDKPVDKKSVFKLAAGIVIGFISSIRKR
ncbi:MAG: YihY/virulence factor BrkB family protein [Pyrinomonadaceae bacterium]